MTLLKFTTPLKLAACISIQPAQACKQDLYDNQLRGRPKRASEPFLLIHVYKKRSFVVIENLWSPRRLVSIFFPLDTWGALLFFSWNFHGYLSELGISPFCVYNLRFDTRFILSIKLIILTGCDTINFEWRPLSFPPAGGQEVAAA